jgi:hypothetical protein
VENHVPSTPAQSPDDSLPKRVPRRKVGPAPAAKAPPIAQSGSWRRRREGAPKEQPVSSWDKLLILVGVAVVALAVLVVPGIVERGGKNPVAQAAAATGEASGVRMNFTMSMQGTVPMTMTGTGVMNGDTNGAQLEFNAHGPTSGGVSDFNFKEVVDGSDIYMNMGALSGQFGTDKSWILIRADEFLGDLVQGGGGLGAGASMSPTQQLEALESASDEVVKGGNEQVGGVATTHYRAVIDIDKAIDQIGGDAGQLGELMKRAMESMGNPTVDVWIDGEGLLRRETSTMTMGPLGTMNMTIDFADYGISPNIEVPPESEVFDMTSMMDGMLGAQS